MRVKLLVCAVALALPCARAPSQPPAAAPAKTAEVEALRKQLDSLATQMQALQQKMQAAQQRLSQLEGKQPSEEEALRAAAKAAAGAAPPAAGTEEEAIRAAAEAAAGAAPPAEEKPEQITFKSGAISQQSLNPEISVTGDMIANYRWDSDADKHSDFVFRSLDMHMQSYLDPYTRFKSAVEVHPDGVELGEAYITRFGVADGLNLTLGKFRQQFGVVNRWHKHALDQVDFPLPLRSIFGEDGLNQAGLSLDWRMPQWRDAAQDLTLQLTNGSNDRVFGENHRNMPSTLIHYKNYRDLNKDTYLEYGITGLFGQNDTWPILDGEDIAFQRDTRWTNVVGADLSVLWEPTERMKYENFEGRAELYWMNKGILAPDDSGPDTLHAWGLYTQLQRKISRTKDVGLRFDYFEPDSKPYADTTGLSLAPLAVTDPAPSRYLVAPYITWWQSPWVKFRMEFDHEWGHSTGPDDNRLMLQCVFAAGPHKHDRY